jgi:hypothetical protein
MASKRGRGQPTKLTKEVQERIVSQIRIGGFLRYAVEAGGIGYTTFQNWLQRGEKYEAGDGPERDRPYFDFATAVRQAQAQDALRMQSIITRAAVGGDWKAASWSLEKKYPHAYGQQPQGGASITIRGGGSSGSSGGTDDSVARVEFYLPDNGRRPDEPGAQSNGNGNGHI